MMTAGHKRPVHSTGVIMAARKQRRYGCPKCGSQYVAQQGLVPVEYTGSFFENDAGEAEFEADECSAEIFWDCEKSEQPAFRRRDCSTAFDTPAELLRDPRHRAIE